MVNNQQSTENTHKIVLQQNNWFNLCEKKGARIFSSAKPEYFFKLVSLAMDLICDKKVPWDHPDAEQARSAGRSEPGSPHRTQGHRCQVKFLNIFLPGEIQNPMKMETF